MEQLEYQVDLFSEISPYKYIMDTCSWLAQKRGDKLPRHNFITMWNDIDELIRRKEIVFSRENIDEIDDSDLKNYLFSLEPEILNVTEAIQVNVRRVVQKCPRLLDFAKEKSSADAFLIATAMEYNITIITEEKEKSPKKIPQVSKCLGVCSVNLLGLCDMQGWSY